MIMREFSIWGKLRHKNVLPLLGYCTHNDAPTMISPWMGNGSIMDYWKENDGKPGARTLLDIVRAFSPEHSPTLNFLYNSRWLISLAA
jgi:serine/threonine protein kinase